MLRIAIPWLILVAGCGAAPGPGGALPACEWCGTDEAPTEGLTSEAVLAGPDEPGERLVVTGTVYDQDGVTPLAGALVYAYQTDLTGRYTTRGDETGNGRRHGRLRGWLVTGADGHYRLDTIRPGGYPASDEPAHIHLTLQPSGGEETWVDSIVFADDPRLTATRRARLSGRGGSGVVHPERDADGIWHAVRDIVLPSGPP